MCDPLSLPAVEMGDMVKCAPFDREMFTCLGDTCEHRLLVLSQRRRKPWSWTPSSTTSAGVDYVDTWIKILVFSNRDKPGKFFLTILVANVTEADGRQCWGHTSSNLWKHDFTCGPCHEGQPWHCCIEANKSSWWWPMLGRIVEAEISCS